MLYHQTNAMSVVVMADGVRAGTMEIVLLTIT